MNNSSFKNSRYYIATACLLAIFFILDRYLKVLALDKFSDSSWGVLGDWLTFTFAPNYYIAFSLPLSGPLLNVLIAAIIIGLIFYLYTTIKKMPNRWLTFGLLLILIGALSNFIDRIIYGYVVDYFYLKYFTIFNLADVGISGGAIITLITIHKKAL